MKYGFKRLILIGMFAASNLTFGQTNQSHDERLEQFKKEMDLTDSQVLKIKAIKDKYAPEKKELKRKLQELKEREIEEIDRIYTPEQKAKLKAILERHRANKK